MNKAAIIGGGVIGGGWAARFLLNGWDVALFDPGPDAERKVLETIANARHALGMLYDRPLPAEGRLTVATSLAEAVGGAVWIQESVPERLELKARVYREIEAAADPEALIGSSTSGFKPSDLRSGLARPERLLVAHPFTPVYLLPLVEIVAGDSPGEIVDRAERILRGIGMEPLRVRQEIDGHIADRLLEAVWRESLWLVKDGVATTEEIDNAIRYGFGLRWAQMGLFETYRIGGGEAGMRHFLEQFGPALAWPWTKLMDVPELDAALVETIAGQSDAQSGARSIRELERHRDENLVVILRALKARETAAGALLRAHERALPAPADAILAEGWFSTVDRAVPIEWTDHNGHMNEGRFGQAFADAADAALARIGAGEDYVARGMSYFTVETDIRFLAEARAGQRIRVRSRILSAEGKKLRLGHAMLDGDGREIATAVQLLIHVSLETRRSAPPCPLLVERIEAMAGDGVGRDATG